tara:strand:+ start:579 stop:1271 length:693 start_codon:yes stop_codon:yes gene_type:complete
MSNIDRIIEQIQQGPRDSVVAAQEHYPDSQIFKDHPHLLNPGNIVEILGTGDVGTELPKYERPDTIAIYAPSSETFGPVSPIQGVVVGLLDYAVALIDSSKIHPDNKPGMKNALEAHMEELYRGLINLDPDLAEEVRHAAGAEEGHSDLLIAQRKAVSGLSRKFADYVGKILTAVQVVDEANPSPPSVTRMAETTPIIACVTQFYKPTVELVKTFGLTHPNLIYATANSI